MKRRKYELVMPSKYADMTEDDMIYGGMPTVKGWREQQQAPDLHLREAALDRLSQWRGWKWVGLGSFSLCAISSSVALICIDMEKTNAVKTALIISGAVFLASAVTFSVSMKMLG